MTTRRFLIVVALGLAGAAACLVLADVLDSAALGVAGVVLVAGVFVAREWWAGHGRRWALIVGVLLAVAAVAFVAQTLTG